MRLIERIWHTQKQSRPNSGLGLQVKVFKSLQVLVGWGGGDLCGHFLWCEEGSDRGLLEASGLGFRVWGLGVGVQGLGFRDWGSGFRV